ncbi:MAG: ATP-binding cassette domain-containing protein [Propionibacteriales bacterium]|nr:ATP-binding cassette domain-containing protein [Propionibacteriales bacterium]
MDISVRDLQKVYVTHTGEEVVALQDVSAEVGSGEFVSLVGPSGCGKSTLLDIVSGLTQRSGGDVTIDGRGVSEGAATRHVGLIFQKPVLLPWRTTFENVYLPAQLGREPAGRGRGDALRQRARDLLELVELGPFAEKYPWELSGGMQQRVAIARALLLEARVMCMDEPFAALDEFTREQMHLELLNLWHAQGFTAIFVTHNIFEAVFLSDRVLVMTPRPGKVVAEVEVDLPRPRTSEMIGSDRFGENIRGVRSVMQEHWVA